MYQDIKRNKFKSGTIVFVFVLTITLIVYYLLHYYDSSPSVIIIAVIFSSASAFLSYYYSDKIVLKINGARPATEEEDRKLVNILDALMVASRHET